MSWFRTVVRALAFNRNNSGGKILVDSDSFQTHIEAPEEQKEPAPDEESTPMHVEDTTGQHNSHLFDLNCKICTGKQLQPGQQPILPHVSTTV